MEIKFEFNIEPERGIIQFIIERDKKKLIIDLTPQETFTLADKSGFAVQAMNDWDIDEPDQYNRKH